MNAVHCMVGMPLLSVLSPSAASADSVILDQIGSSGASWMAAAASSSQFSPGDPQGAFVTVDNFALNESVHVSKIEGVVAALQDFVSYDDVLSWHVNIYNSLDAASSDFFGDVYTQSYLVPDAMTSGFSFIFDGPSEITTFNVNVILDPGEYWLTIAMENDAELNGVVGIRASTVGDGPALFASPSLGDTFALSNPAAYRVIGSVIPTPGAIPLLLASSIRVSTRRRGGRREHAASPDQ